MIERDGDLYRSVERFKAEAYRRVGQEALPAHLEKTYGVRVAGTAELDGGVVRIDLVDGGREGRRY